MQTLLNSLLQRRTVRKYSDRTIDSQLLTQLFEAACKASTTGNMQLYSIVQTTTVTGKATLAPAHFNQPTVTQAPLVLTFCADYNRFALWCKERNAICDFNNFQSFLTAAIDALLVAQQFATAAEAAGLGICYLGTTTYNAASIIDALHLPKLVMPITTLTVGYADGEPPLADRLPLAAVLHKEQYLPYTKDKINAYYTPKESLEENIAFVQENHKENLAQIFTDIRYPQKDSEYFSGEFLNTLRTQGFIK